MRFTSEEAYEAHQYGDPIMVDHDAAAKICRDHDADMGDYVTEQENGQVHPTYDAWDILGWLGY